MSTVKNVIDFDADDTKTEEEKKVEREKFQEWEDKKREEKWVRWEKEKEEEHKRIMEVDVKAALADVVKAMTYQNTLDGLCDLVLKNTTEGYTPGRPSSEYEVNLTVTRIK